MIIFRMLGSLHVEGQPAGSALSRQRTVRGVLAALLHHPDQHLGIGRLIEHVWPTPPTSAHANLRTRVTALRRAIEESSPGLGARLITQRGHGGGSYRLSVAADEVDALLFARLTERGHHELLTGDVRAAAATLGAALRLWRGPVGEDLPDTLPLRIRATELNDRRLAAADDHADARLALGDHAGIVSELRSNLAANPLRERTAELLIRALDATGDRGTAVMTYLRFRAHIVDELGLEPSTRLELIYQALLRDQLDPIAGIPSTTPLARLDGGRQAASRDAAPGGGWAPSGRFRAPVTPSDEVWEGREHVACLSCGRAFRGRSRHHSHATRR